VGIDRDERLAAWFSHLEDEPHKLLGGTGGPPRVMTREERIEWSYFRIEVQPSAAPVTWTQSIEPSGVSRESVRKMRQYAKRCNSDPYQYRASFEPVKQTAWVGVEQLSVDGWRKIDVSTPPIQVIDTDRRLDRSLFVALCSCQWVSQHLNVLITGPTGRWPARPPRSTMSPRRRCAPIG
jgi:hypothetical protein